MQPYFLLIGQSNMAGRGNLDELPAEEKSAPAIEIFRNGEWLEACHPLQDANDPVFAVNADRASGVGPGLSFARAVQRATDMPVGLLQCAKGGTGIQAWERGGVLYRTMLERLRRASASRSLAGALIHVGEGDTHSPEMAEAWANAFRQLIGNLRSDTGDPVLPVVFAQIATITPEMRTRRDHGYAGWERLKQVQASVDLPSVVMVKTDDLPLKPDGLHLSTQAAMVLGERFAAAILEMDSPRVPSAVAPLPRKPLPSAGCGFLSRN
jgi:hypothetical protein